MNKLTLLLFLILCYSSSNSQVIHFDAGASSSKLDLKFKFQNITEQHYDDPLLALSFSTGIEYFEHKYFSLSSDLYYYKSGGKYSKEELSNTSFLFIEPSKVSIECLSLGSAFNFYPLNKKFKLQLSLGPKVDYILSSDKKIPFSMIDKCRKMWKFNYGYTAGVGFYYKQNKNIVGINIKYLGRLQKLADQKQSYDQFQYYSGAVSSDQIVMVSLSYGIRLK